MFGNYECAPSKEVPLRPEIIKIMKDAQHDIDLAAQNAAWRVVHLRDDGSSDDRYSGTVYPEFFRIGVIGPSGQAARKKLIAHLRHLFDRALPNTTGRTLVVTPVACAMAGRRGRDGSVLPKGRTVTIWCNVALAIPPVGGLVARGWHHWRNALPPTGALVDSWQEVRRIGRTPLKTRRYAMDLPHEFTLTVWADPKLRHWGWDFAHLEHVILSGHAPSEAGAKYTCELEASKIIKGVLIGLEG